MQKTFYLELKQTRKEKLEYKDKQTKQNNSHANNFLFEQNQSQSKHADKYKKHRKKHNEK